MKCSIVPAKESPASQRDREERLRIIRDKQNEERQKKLDELKQQVGWSGNNKHNSLSYLKPLRSSFV